MVESKFAKYRLNQSSKTEYLILAESLRYPAHRHHIGEHSFRYTLTRNN